MRLLSSARHKSLHSVRTTACSALYFIPAPIGWKKYDWPGIYHCARVVRPHRNVCGLIRINRDAKDQSKHFVDSLCQTVLVMKEETPLMLCDTSAAASVLAPSIK